MIDKYETYIEMKINLLLFVLVTNSYKIIVTAQFSLFLNRINISNA
jgi:hypothetical protein